ncbi:MAG: hypothetical protein V2A67_04485 [Bacteroidota bacterium]
MKAQKLMNRKQVAWSQRIIERSVCKTRLKFLITLIGIFIGTALVFAAVNPSADNFRDAAKVGGGGTVLASMAVIGNIGQTSERSKAGHQIGYKVWLIARDQIDSTVPFPTPNAAREVGSVTLKAGELMHYFEAIDDTLKDNSTGEKGEIATDVTNTFVFIMGGNPVKLMDFLEEYAGRGFVIIFQECDSQTKYILGTLCKPMILKSFNRSNDGESKSATMTFENKSFTQPLIYTGSIVSAAPVVVAAGATDLAIEDNPQYQLSGHSAQVTIATVSSIASMDYGRVIDVLGIASGSNPPKISDNTVFILIDGAEWTGNTGSRISLRIIDDATLVEVAGTRIQT